MSIGTDAHDPSGPMGHLPSFAGEEMIQAGRIALWGPADDPRRHAASFFLLI
jgi:hypothetical protein